jgi:hypothetical protein
MTEVTKPEGPRCLVCNKPLTDPESVALGVGPLCHAKGWTKESVAAKMADLKKTEVPEGWIKLAAVADRCRAEEIPVSRLVRAVGGDRGMEDPIKPMFQVIYVGRARYLSPETISPEGLAILAQRNLGEPVPEKPKKEPKPKKEKKAKNIETATIEEVWKES